MIKRCILSTGEFSSPDGRINATEARMRHWSDQFRRLSANGYRVPINWNPANPRASSYYGQQSPRNTVGHLADLEPIAGGLEFVLEITDPQAIMQANRGLAAVPVVVDHWRDGTSQTYEDLILFVDMLSGDPSGTVPPLVAMSLNPGNTVMGLRMSIGARMSRPAWPVDELSPSEVSRLANWALGKQSNL